MGTSVNQRSPDTDNWRLVQGVYDNPNIPIDQALREVWRAASNENEVSLAALLSQPTIGRFVSLVDRVTSQTEAFQEANSFIADNKIASLASEIAKRAVIQSAGTESPRQQYCERLFAEATNYLVARDIPGHIAPGRRLQNVSDARKFTQQMMDTTKSVVRTTPIPNSLDGENWSKYVDAVVRTIRRRQR